MLFADDSLIFISGNTQSAARLNEILRVYGDASGQCVNRAKSAVYFSSNTPAQLKQQLKAVLNIDVEAFSERYLGLPTRSGASQVELSITSGKQLAGRCRDGLKNCLRVQVGKLC